MLKNVNTPLHVIVLAVKDWWRDWVNLSAFTLGWLACWATIFMGPPATFILYAVVHEYVRGRSFHTSEIPNLFRRYFLKSWLWCLLNIAVLGGVQLNLRYYSRVGGVGGDILASISIAVATAWLIIQFYALPFFMEQAQPTLRTAFRNALLTTFASPFYTLTVGLFALFIASLMMKFLVLVFLGLPAFIAVLGAHTVAERLRTFGKKV